MYRPVATVILSLGAIGGLLIAAHSHRYHDDHREAFQRKVADVCTDSALRVYEQRFSPPPTQ